MNKIITFEYHHQDFLTFEVTPEGKIVDVQPFQYSIWSQFKVTNFDTLLVGGYVNLEHMSKKGLGSCLIIKYPIELITTLNEK